jgi:hypothetical protein
MPACAPPWVRPQAQLLRASHCPCGTRADALLHASSLPAERRAAHGGSAARSFEVLCLGVAALMVSSQANVTGPAPDAAPACPGVLPHRGAAADDRAAWDAWAVSELCAGGEDVVGKTTFPQYLVLGASHAAAHRRRATHRI